MLCGNKLTSKFTLKELYSKRVKVINWFSVNKPEMLDLYGPGWGRFPSASINGGGFPQKVINKLRRVVLGNDGNPIPIYKGMAQNKIQTLSNYRFNICYENVYDEDGYLTEKIFDSLVAGAYPIYCGGSLPHYSIPDDLYKLVKPETSPKELYDSMMSYTENQYISFQKRALEYLWSPQFKKQSPEFFARKFLTKIKKISHYENKK